MDIDMLKIGRLMRGAIEKKRDKPKIAVLEYMQNEFNTHTLEELHYRLPAIFKQARKIWEENL